MGRKTGVDKEVIKSVVQKASVLLHLVRIEILNCFGR
jgi:hypothetical protein